MTTTPDADNTAPDAASTTQAPAPVTEQGEEPHGWPEPRGDQVPPPSQGGRVGA